MKKLLSRKWLMALLTILVFALNRLLGAGLTEDDMQRIVTVAAAYLGAEGLADAVGAFRKK